MKLKDYRFEKNTWKDIGRMNKNRVLLLPVGAIEQHGPHLPLDTDALIVTEICRKIGEIAPDLVSVLPTISYGLSHHHMDFPGTLTLSAHTLSQIVVEVLKSAAFHRFNKMLIVNGHDGNIPALDLAARQINRETNAFCGVLLMWGIVRRVGKCLPEIKMSIPDHGGEKETSMYLAIDDECPDMERATGLTEEGTTDQWKDFYDSTEIILVDRFVSYTKTGALGNFKTANKEKGDLLFKASVPEMIRVIERFNFRKKFREENPIQKE